MNELQEKILALLVAKFQGVRKDGLQHLAAAIGLQVANEEEANQIVDKLTADKVSAFVTEWRRSADAEISRANQTYENSLKEKYDFVDKGKQTPPAGQQTPPDTSGAVTLDAISKLIDEKMKGVQDSITTLNADKVAETRRKLFVAKLDEAKVEGRQREMMLRNFDRVNSFANEEDFNSYMTEAQGDIAALQQENADKGLQGHEKPIFGAVNKDGVSSGVADFIKAQSENNKTLTGKEV
jgi:hypothetical protein